MKPNDPIIEGVKVIPLYKFEDDRGGVYQMLKSTDPHFSRFGDIYFSTVYPGIIKAWKNHRDITVNFACIFGSLKLALYDEREDSPTRALLMEMILSPDNYNLVVIPPGVWNGFKGMSRPIAILANCATGPNDPSEYDRLDPIENHIPYKW